MKHRHTKALSVLLTICMIVALIPWATLPARADGNIAKVGETEYSDIKAAIKAAAKNDKPVILLKDIETKSAAYLNISSDYIFGSNANTTTITLDLNNHGIVHTASNHAINIEEGYTLILKDGAQTKTPHYIMLDKNDEHEYKGLRGVGIADTEPEGTEGVDYLAVTGGFITGGYGQCSEDPHGLSWGGGAKVNGTLMMEGGTLCGSVL